MFEVVALGELLIDFTPAGHAPSGEKLFQQNPGGAPANVVSCLARFGRRTGFIGKVGDDQFGHDLKQVLETNNVSTAGLVLDSTAHTTLAFVHLTDQGERSFSFYRDPGADTLLTRADVNPDLLNTKIFHFGSLSLTDEPARSTTFEVLEQLKAQGVFISYDPNLRPLLWPSLAEAKERMLQGMDYADLIKLTDEELEFLLGTTDLERGAAELTEQYNLAAVFVTLGERGCFYYVQGQAGTVPAFRVNVVDTTGSGDGFTGGMLHRILESPEPITAWDRDALESSVRFANAVGGLVATKKGGIPAMPTLAEVHARLAR